MCEGGRAGRLAPYALMLLLGMIEPATHVWIQFYPPPGSVPTGLHTGDSGHHLAAMESFGNGFASPFATCQAEDGGAGLRYFAPPIFLLYGVFGEMGRLLGAPMFLWLGVINGLGGIALLWSVYRFLCCVAPERARAAFYLYALGGGLGGVVFLGALLTGGVAAPGFEAWFQRFAQYELIEGQHLSPVLLMPRFYYTLPLAVGFAALTALVETDRCRCPGHLIFAGILFFLAAAINVRVGALVWGLGLCYLVAGSGNAPAYRAHLAVATGGFVAAGSALFLWAAGFHPSYMANVAGVTRQCVFLLPLLYATAFHWPGVFGALRRCAGGMATPWRILAAAVGGYLLAYAAIHVAHQAWYGNWSRGGDLPAALMASDWALMAVPPAAWIGWRSRSRGQGEADPLAWVALAFLVLLAASLSTWGQGWFLQFSPQRTMVALGVPLALLAAAGMGSWRPVARRAGFGLVLGCGLLSQAVAALYFQGPLGRATGAGPFAYLHYSIMTDADARLLGSLPEGTVAVPPWSPIAFGEVVARQGPYRVVGGPGAMNLGEQPFGPLQESVNRFFSGDAMEGERRAFVEAWCVDYVYCPDTCPVDVEVVAALRAAPWLELIAEAGRGAVFRVGD